MINPIWLRSFCTLVEVGHFTRTAQRLNMTQSGVSQQVHKLEDQLGQSLLVRQGKQFTLTDAGERLYQEGVVLLRSLLELEQRITDDPEFEGTVRIVSPGSIGLKLYRALLLLQQQHPALVIDYRFAPNDEVEKRLADNKADIGFMTRPSNMSEVSFKPLAEEALLLVTPKQVTNPSWSQLLALGFIDHPDGAYHAGLLLGANYAEFEHCSQFKKSGFSNQINLILEPVSMGLGFTVLPSHAVAAFSQGDNIAIHPLENQISEVLYLGFHSNQLLPNRVKTVIAEAKKCLR